MTDRVWLITGSSSGLGRALAETVVARGDSVAATARDVTALAGLADLDGVGTYRLDVTDRASIEAAVAAAEHDFGRIDVLVNNAGYALLGAYEEIGDAELRTQFDTNVFGAMNVARAVLPGMRRRRDGCIVQMSSLNGVVPGAGGSAYVGSKFALEGMSEALAAETAHLGIKVVITEAGPFRTDFGGKSLHWGTPMDDYDDVIGPARAAFEASHGSQPGDPHRAAQAIVDAVDLADPPLRLPLGGEAFELIEQYLSARLTELPAAAAIGADTAYRELV
ncbi:oxidoreductase [Antrihabitans cavernicola]|uniref:SDR family NAD(P)-dependent oxidoreductase n=1 Tax=Antrihabitans cavernicola TaxID=2495913 RepID=A0A5A7S667_9NOCA|nr:oxidoreductase [Spelaeibacter cavernicola]KAA0021658.1 SDR family NAD(P)-dependent oxidoreductase [Spelaeibacter cavernicola]